MDIPGKEKVLDQLKESLKKSLTEDTHYKYTPGKEVETPMGTGIVTDIVGGTITVQLSNGQPADFQINVLDAIEAKKQRDSQFGALPDLGKIGQNWLSSQVNEEAKDKKTEKKDKYSKLKEYLKKVLKKEAIKFKAGGETIFKNNSEAGSYEMDLKKSGVKYTKTNVS